MQDTVSFGEFLAVPFIVLGFFLFLAFIVSGYPKRKILQKVVTSAKMPSPLDQVRYVQMIYTNPDGTKFCSIEEAKVEYSGQPDIKSLRYRYHIFIDSALFVDERLSKSFILLDRNKNRLPNPSNCSISYYDVPESGCGFIEFSVHR